MKRRPGYRKDGGIDRRFGKEPINKKTERNEELMRDIGNGVKNIDLITKYGISSSRIYQLRDQYRKSHDRQRGLNAKILGFLRGR